MIWGEFIHQAARAVDGHAPDPHLHAHCFVFNEVWDEVEQRIKAGKFRDIKRSMPHFEACFQKRLADNLVKQGYRVRPKGRSFEVQGIDDVVIAHFSKRTDQIGRVAKEKNITDAKELDALGAKTRSKKQRGLGMADLKADWRKQIGRLTVEHDLDPDKVIRFAKEPEREHFTREDCLHFAILHCFERASVMSEKGLLDVACKYALGQTQVSIDDLSAALKHDPRLIGIHHNGQDFLTTREVLREERRMVSLARQGMNKLEPLYPDIKVTEKDDQQSLALAEVLTTTNRVSIIRGAAGAGKTALLKRGVRMIEDAGITVTMLAPTAKAAREVLRGEGFDNAETVASFLANKEAQAKVKGQALIVDEGGLLGTKEMLSLLEIATEQNARLIILGDTRQHSSVVRGDALRILNTIAEVPTAEVNIIRRQRYAPYRDAVQDLSKGDIAGAFKKLDAMGAIETIDFENPNAELVGRYLDVTKAGKSALVISPTHAQGESLTADIRQKLRQAKRLGKKESNHIRYVNLGWTEAQKGDRRNFEKGQAIQFNQNMKGIKRGDIWNVTAVDGLDVHLTNANGEACILPRERAKDYDVFEVTDIALSKGDKVRITRNGYDTQGKRLDNGTSLDVAAVSLMGKIRLQNPVSKTDYILDDTFGHLAHDYCVTSYASQGKTVDEVLISLPVSTFAAVDSKQFYVSVSRGRDNVFIFTDDRDELLATASELGERQSALELLQKQDTQTDYVLLRQRQEKSHAKGKEIEKDNLEHDYLSERDYEPV